MDDITIDEAKRKIIDTATALRLADAIVGFSKAAVESLWTIYCKAYDTMWASDTSIAVEIALHDEFLATATTHISLSTGATVQTNNWAALFMEAADVKALVQLKHPDLLLNLPTFTDGTTKYIDPGWVLDANWLPVSPKVLATLVAP